MTEALLASQSNSLCPGPLLDQQQDTQLTKRLSRVCRHPVTDADAATMFYLNLQSLKDHSFIVGHYASEKIQRIEQELLTLSQSAGDKSQIEWGMRQVAFQRV